MKILLSEKSEIIMDDFMNLGEGLDHDWFTEYFEEQHANKSKMSQDFTPKEVAALAAGVAGKADKVADICAGTGGLTISVWNQNHDTEFVCYELSNRAIPLLLLNLAIRNIRADVVRTDILTGEEFEKYRVIPGEKYGKVIRNEEAAESGEILRYADIAISNPPYSAKYKAKEDNRFEEYKEFLPSNFADYVFVAFALSITRPGGKIVFILPQGVLFRGNKEKEFRRYLIEKKYIRTVIGLPDKLFINTDIPVLVLEIDTNGKGDGVFFIAADEMYEKRKSKNVIPAASSETIMELYQKREEKERVSKFATYQMIGRNDYNMNIPRYVDKYVPEEVPDLEKILEELAVLEKEALKAEISLVDMAAQLCGTNEAEDRKYKAALKKYKKILTGANEEYAQEVLKLW